MIARTRKPPSRRKPHLTEDQTVELADMLALLGETSRLKIVLACLDGAASVGAIAVSAKLSPSLVSHHLRLLRAARLLRAERRGKQVFYEIADHHVSRVIADMVAHVVEPGTREH